MPAKKQPEINLLPVDKFSKSLFGRFITWLLSTFRVIVIMVEMVVMLAFLSRFWLDAKNSDLNDELTQKEAIIAASQAFADNYNLAAQKMALFTKLSGSGQTYWEIVNKVSTYIPPDVSLTSINIDVDKASVAGEAPSSQSIAQTAANLKNIPNFSRVALGSLSENMETGQLKFKIDFLPFEKEVKQNAQ